MERGKKEEGGEKDRPKARRRATKAPRKAALPKKTRRRGKATPRKSAQKRAGKRTGAARKLGTARAPAGSRKAAASRVAADRASKFSPAGEVYGAESWKEEELSAAELDPEAPEAELKGPEIVDESDDSEW